MGKVISKAEYEDLVADAKVLEEQSFGVKVWLLPDQRIVKMFRLKRPVSSGRLYPYNIRFARNARRCLARGVAAPNIRETFYCPDIQRHGVIYDLLEGDPFFELLPETSDETLFRTFARFLGELHEKGIYFRSVHPGNVLLRPDGSMGLIDIQDMRFWPWALTRKVRARNFRHLYNSDYHSKVMRDFGFERFADLYLEELPRDEGYKDSMRPLIMDWDKAWERKKRKPVSA
jgi:tRNA A-37 threonylcarbamoyl transferase component Bud32